MNAWMLLWKIVLIAGIVLFGCMAVWVIIWGAFDIRKMLASMNTEHAKEAASHDSELKQ